MKERNKKERGVVQRTAGLKAALLALCVLLLLTGGLTGVQTVMGAESSPALSSPAKESINTVQKTEVVYAKLSSTGILQNTYVVNTLEPTEAGTLIDFGSYKKVQNLTNTSALGVSGDAVLVDIDQSQVNRSLSYQGDMGQQALPWSIQVEYLLDGVSVPAEQLAGTSGKLELGIDVRCNDQVQDRAFFENYLVTLTVTLGEAVARNISAPDAQVARAGSDTQLTFMVMPGKEARFSVTADVENFEMDALSVAAIPFGIVFDFPDSDNLVAQFSQLTDAVKTLDSGAAALAAGACDLASGIAELEGGAADVAEGAAGVAEGAAGVAEGAAGVAAGTTDLAAGAADVSAGAADVSAGTTDVAAGAAGIAQGLSQYQQGLLGEAARIQQADSALGSADDLQAAYEQAMQGYVGAFAESYSQTFAQTYAQVYAQVYAQAYGEARQGGATEEAAVQAAIQAATTQASQQAVAVAVPAAEASAQMQVGAVQEALSNIAAKAGYAGSLQALQGAADGVGSADDQESLLGGAVSLAEGASSLAEGASSLLDGTAQLSGGAARLSGGASQLSGGAAQLSGGAAQLSGGAQDFADGVGQAASGASRYAQGSQEFAEGMQAFQGETEGLPDSVRAEIDALMADYGKSDFVPRSFVSSKNTNVKLVQFVMSTESISLPSEEKPHEADPVLTPLDRLLALFK